MTLGKEIEIKTNILIEGLQADVGACQGVGQEFTENINWIFAYDRMLPRKKWGGGDE